MFIASKSWTLWRLSNELHLALCCSLDGTVKLGKGSGSATLTHQVRSSLGIWPGSNRSSRLIDSSLSRQQMKSTDTSWSKVLCPWHWLCYGGNSLRVCHNLPSHLEGVEDFRQFEASNLTQVQQLGVLRLGRGKRRVWSNSVPPKHHQKGRPIAICLQRWLELWDLLVTCAICYIWLVVLPTKFIASTCLNLRPRPSLIPHRHLLGRVALQLPGACLQGQLRRKRRSFEDEEVESLHFFEVSFSSFLIFQKSASSSSSSSSSWCSCVSIKIFSYLLP